MVPTNFSSTLIFNELIIRFHFSNSLTAKLQSPRIDHKIKNYKNLGLEFVRLQKTRTSLFEINDIKKLNIYKNIVFFFLVKQEDFFLENINLIFMF